MRSSGLWGDILFRHHGTFEIGPLNRLLNEAVLFHLFDELVRIGSAGGPVFWIADRKHCHHVVSGHNTPSRQFGLCERQQVSKVTAGICLTALEHFDNAVRRTDRDWYSNEFCTFECLAEFRLCYTRHKLHRYIEWSPQF